jgi:hypothetical protein
LANTTSRLEEEKFYLDLALILRRLRLSLRIRFLRHFALITSFSQKSRQNGFERNFSLLQHVSLEPNREMVKCKQKNEVSRHTNDKIQHTKCINQEVFNKPTHEERIFISRESDKHDNAVRSSQVVHGTHGPTEQNKRCFNMSWKSPFRRVFDDD